MGIEHKESLQECQTSPEGMPLTWAREHGIDTRIPGFAHRDQDGDGVSTLMEWKHVTRPRTGSPGQTGNPCRYEKPEHSPAHLGAPAPSSRSFASFAQAGRAASPCRSRLRGGCKSATSRTTCAQAAQLREPFALLPCLLNRRLHGETTGFFFGTVAKCCPERAVLRPLLRTAGASSPRPFRHRRRRNSAYLPRIIGFCPPILSVLALPQVPAPGEKKGRRHPVRPLKRSPRKPAPGLLE